MLRIFTFPTLLQKTAWEYTQADADDLKVKKVISEEYFICCNENHFVCLFHHKRICSYLF